MHKPTDKQVTRYAERLMRKMKITCRQAFVFIYPHNASEDIASVTCNYDTNCLNMSLFPLFLLQDSDGQRETIVHELLHWEVNRLMMTADALENRPEGDPPGITRKRFQTELESIVDFMARLIAPAMPEVPWDAA